MQGRTGLARAFETCRRRASRGPVTPAEWAMGSIPRIIVLPWRGDAILLCPGHKAMRQPPVRRCAGAASARAPLAKR